ncbi:MAG: hypothetical protein V2I82_04015 [Halieaceae bacterium]|jgi:D-glycerate 3-kinase|nr:hypothetical protein [Halieaceae bacterium]
MADWRERFLEEQRLTPAYLRGATRYFEPLAAELAGRRRRREGTLTVAVNGSQGSGKSTLCAYLREVLAHEHGLSCIDLSLDDFYLTRAEREALAAEVHPLLRTRGVPGTHDTGLLRETLKRLAGNGRVAVPRFSKADDDRLPAEQWSRVDAPVDVVLLEGWCLGARSVAAAELSEPINELERDEDAQGRWRNYCNDRLRTHYEPLYDSFDCWVMLAAPAFEQVLRWRTEQEEKLRIARGGAGSGLMDEAALRRFVAHFERHTRHCLAQLPSRCDVVLSLDERRSIVSLRGLPAPAAPPES